MTTPDVLALGAHPDDVELTVGGTLLLAHSLGLQTAICHVTAGEMGSRGDEASRRREAARAAEALGVGSMEILGLPDGRLTLDGASLIERLVDVIRRHRPRIILAPFERDLHPDHEAVGRAVVKAAFLSGLSKWTAGGAPWRPERILHYMSHQTFEPRLVVDISDHFAAKRRAAACYASQFHDLESKEPETYIARPDFWHWWEARASYWGNTIGVRHAEPFWINDPIPSRDPFALFSGFGKYRSS